MTQGTRSWPYDIVLPCICAIDLTYQPKEALPRLFTLVNGKPCANSLANPSVGRWFVACHWLVIRMTSKKEHVTRSTNVLINRDYLSFKQIMYFFVLAKSVDKNYGIRSKSYIV